MPRCRASQSLLGERGYLFTQKGAASSGSRSDTRWTDEEVVYTALAHALRTGSETFVLTKDEDLLDELYRLVYLSRHPLPKHADRGRGRVTGFAPPVARG